MNRLRSDGRFLPALVLALTACGTSSTHGATAPVDGSPGIAAACAAAGEPVPAAERVPNGHPILPPKWAFGVLYGSYFDQVSGSGSPGNLLDAMTQLRSDYSGDLMWIDSSWLSGTYAGGTGARYICFQFDPQTFDDPGTLIATLRSNHFHFGVWEWPWMDSGCALYAYGVTSDLFVVGADGGVVNAGGWHDNAFTGAFDYTDPAAVAWWHMDNQALVDWGLDFMKLDTPGGPPDGGVLFDPAIDYRGAYHRSAYDVTAAYSARSDPLAATNGARGFILTHLDPSAGNDQTPGMWTGDSTASWAGLTAEMVLASGLDATDTAVYWCGDTGGYNGTPTDELYIRWLEYTTFTPLQEFFGAKVGSTGNRFPWGFSTQAQDLFRTYTGIRYGLLPFRYSSALAAYLEPQGPYPVRWIGSTQLLVGNGSSQILVQPVTTEGATSATVELPAGSSWVHYFTGQVYPGGGTVTVPAPIDQEPVFVKSGSILPTGPPLRWVDEVPADPLTLDIYPDGSTSYSLYEDDGTSQGYMGGAYSTTKISCSSGGGHVVVDVGAQAIARHTYAGRICARTYVLEIHEQASPPAIVTRDGVAVPPSSAASFDSVPEGWYYDAPGGTAWVKFPLSSDAATEVKL